MKTTYPRFDQRVYDKHFTQDKTDWLKDNYNKFTDRAAGLLMNIPKRIVTSYRHDVLQLHKLRKKKYDTTFMVCKATARMELEALKAFDYHGLMRESFEARISFLKTIIG